MKKYFSICVLIALLVSCKDTNPPSSGDEIQEVQLAIIKISPEMQEQVFVSPLVDSVIVDNKNLSTLYYGNYLGLCNPATDTILAEFTQSQFNILGTSPYLILDNGYAIIDWRWSHFHVLSGVFRNVLFNDAIHLPGYSTNPNRFYTIVNEEYYLLPYKWQELNDLTATWKLEKGSLIEKPEVRYINLKDIEEYGDYTTNSRDISLRYNVMPNDLQAVYNLYHQDKARFAAYVEEYTKLQSSYVKTLNQMINNNDFEKWMQHE